MCCAQHTARTPANRNCSVKAKWKIMTNDLSQNQHRTDVALNLPSPNGMVFPTSINKMKGETNQMAFGVTVVQPFLDTAPNFLLRSSVLIILEKRKMQSKTILINLVLSISMDCDLSTHDSNQWHIKMINVNRMRKKKNKVTIVLSLFLANDILF